MHNFYNMIPEKRSTWRNAYEVKIAALEHEKQRFQLINEDVPFLKLWDSDSKERKSGWSVLFKTPLRLLQILIG